MVIDCLAMALNEVTSKYKQELWPTKTSLEFRNLVKHQGYLKAWKKRTYAEIRLDLAAMAKKAAMDTIKIMPTLSIRYNTDIFEFLMVSEEKDTELNQEFEQN